MIVNTLNTENETQLFINLGNRVTLLKREEKG